MSVAGVKSSEYSDMINTYKANGVQHEDTSPPRNHNVSISVSLRGVRGGGAGTV